MKRVESDSGYLKIDVVFNEELVEPMKEIM